MRLSRASLVLAALGALSVAAVSAGVAPARKDAESLKRKVASINAFAVRPAKQGLRTIVTQNEVNAYLAYDARDQIPKGVVEPTILVLGGGRLEGHAIADLDAVRQQHQSTSMMDPINLLTGRLPVVATGTLTTKDGVGKFDLESASIGGIPVPKMLLQEIVSYYSRSPGNPAGVSIDDRFQLPARIREIQVDRGQAVVIQ